MLLTTPIPFILAKYLINRDKELLNRHTGRNPMTKLAPTKSPLFGHTCQNSRFFYGLGLAAVLAVPAQQSIAGGFQLSDHSISSLGRNHAGYGVIGDDASAIQFNPAGLTLLADKQVQLGFAFSTVSAEVVNDGSNVFGGAIAGPNQDGAPSLAVAPTLYYVHPVTDKLVVGIGVVSPFGTDTDYDDDFFGRFSGTETQLTTIDINPSVGYKINDIVSIGGGFSVQTADVTLDSRLPLGPASGDGGFEANGDSVAAGVNVGVTVDLPDTSRLGFSLRSGIVHDIDADTEFEIPSSNPLSAFAGEFGATAEFESPATAYLAYFRPITRDYFITAGIRWTQWNTFEEIRIEFDDAGGANPLTTNDAVTPIDWSNSFTYAVGIDGRVTDQWSWRAGFSFTETPVPDATRSVRTIDSDRTAISFGGSYKPIPELSLDFAYRFISFADADINQPIISQGNPVGATIGSVAPDVNTLAIQANYRF